MRNSVVLPAPFGPTSPTFSPRWSAADVDEDNLLAVLLTDIVEADHDFPTGAAVGNSARNLPPLDHRAQVAQERSMSQPPTG
jgi:hypothetical protein